MATDDGIGYLSFIGSAKVGWYLRSKLAPGTRCGLEHGGAAPVIVDSSADIKAMIAPLVKGAFYHAGQVCVSVQRVYILDEVFDQVCDEVAAAASELRVGDPASKKSDLGPLIFPEEVLRVNEWIKEAESQGAEIAFGGEILSKTTHQPTVILNPPADAKVSTQEIFGPVVCLYKCSSIEEALAGANSLPYAFQASVFSKDIDTAMLCSKRLNATAVMINDHTAFRVDWMPFGGRQHSGLGLGGIGYSVHEMTRDKLTVIKL